MKYEVDSSSRWFVEGVHRLIVNYLDALEDPRYYEVNSMSLEEFYKALAENPKYEDIYEVIVYTFRKIGLIK